MAKRGQLFLFDDQFKKKAAELLNFCLSFSKRAAFSKPYRPPGHRHPLFGHDVSYFL